MKALNLIKQTDALKNHVVFVVEDVIADPYKKIDVDMSSERDEQYNHSPIAIRYKLWKDDAHVSVSKFHSYKFENLV